MSTGINDRSIFKNELIKGPGKIEKKLDRNGDMMSL